MVISQGGVRPAHEHPALGGGSGEYPPVGKLSRAKLDLLLSGLDRPGS